MISFEEVHSKAHIAEVAKLAREIWIDHYVPMVGREQVDYMLDKFQSEQAVGQQVSGNYEYYLVAREGHPAGYVAVVPDTNEASLLLSKIYVRKQERCHGVGKSILHFVENLCARRGIKTMWLTVNKNNTGSISWYMRMGFRNAGPILQDIGNGFVMDDFRMEKDLGPQSR